MNVLLLDEGFMSGAYTALGLRRAGCDVHVLAATGGRGSYQADGSTWEIAGRVGSTGFLARLERIAGSARHEVIYPLTEPLQRLSSDTSGPWSDRLFPRFDDAMRRAIDDKQCMSARMAAAGVSVPEERPARTDDEVSDGVTALGLPVVAKGSRGRGGSATAIVNSVEGARSEARRIRARGVKAFLQTYVDGPTFLAGGLFDRGEPLRFYAGEKLVQFPARVGPAVEMRSTHDRALVDTALAVFKAANVTGLASGDFIRDTDGRFQFLELNARPWGSITAAADAGVDLFTPLVQLWRRQPVAPCLDFEAGRRSAVFPLYLLSFPFWNRDSAFETLRADARRASAFLMDQPGLAAHLAHRLMHVGLNW